jgi:hypothetical protein
MVMTNEERDLITAFVARTTAAGGEAIDPEADALLKQLFEKHPEARYRIAQLAFFQEHALAEATNRINQLEWQGQQQQPKGLLGGLFGGSSGPTTPAPVPVHAPGHRPDLFAQNRPGFLGTAASTAVGVLGGIMLGNALASMMGMGGTAEAATPMAEEEPSGFDSAVFDDEEL